MDRVNGSPRLMIVSDLDYTMVDHEDPENLALLRFNALWEANYRHDSLLVFSTGRSPTLYKQLKKEKPLLTPDIVVSSVGTEIMFGDLLVQDDDWAQLMNKKWNRNIVTEETAKFPELSLQSETEQRPHKVSFYVEKVQAPKILRPLSECLEKRGVSNAQEELLQWYAENAKNNRDIFLASERCAAAIIQAIGYFGLGPNISLRDVSDPLDCEEETLIPVHEVLSFYLFYERWRHAEVQKSEQSIEKLRSVFYSPGIFVHPSGFEQPLHKYIDELVRSYGDMQGTEFWVWLDKVSSAQIGSDTWLVKFDKWELSGERRECCLTTVLMCSKPDEVPNANRLRWMHVHQTRRIIRE